ncbi:MAG: PepSY domain-containing protein [Alphaproteobacteria bacterium]
MKHLKFGALVPAVLSVLLLGTSVPPAEAQTTYVKHYIAHERIGMVHARAIALRQHPGKVVRWGLVRDRNGEERYVFNIRNSSGLYAVGVDADSGVVVQNFKATPARAPRTNFWDRLFAPTRIGN